MNVYCKDVQPGKGRMFLCLQSNLAKVDFSQACKLRVEEKQSRQQNYYMLDFGVRTACKSTVDRLCSSVKVRPFTKICLTSLVTNISDKLLFANAG